MGFPLCRVCKAGDMVPLSDYGDGELVYKAWVRTNEGCAAIIHIRKGDVFFTHAEVLSPMGDTPPPEPEPEPAPPGSTWQVFQRDH